MSSNFPIGIFDSGIGGLTVAAAIHKALPKEQLVYFGDTAHLPYGDKSAEAIKYYSLKIGKFLLEKKCKMIVVACNTASSYAYADLVEFLGAEVPIVNVIDPVVAHIVNKHEYKRVGVIATKATVRSNVYANKILAADASIEVASLATPLLAPMIEEGFFNNNISKTVINSYLSATKLKKIEALILACTHYPLIQKEIESYYNNKVEVVNSAGVVADHVALQLEKLDLLHEGEPKRHRFYISDFTPSFEKSTRLFFGEKIHLSHKPIWD